MEPGSSEYTREELIAEMGASFLFAHTGIDLESVTENSVAYLAGWLKHLQDDNKRVYCPPTAAAHPPPHERTARCRSRRSRRKGPLSSA
ncbi:zincin-like metallopeptidase domain-containing protein [Neolewinella litorea]|uniref:zincin-like metallopeptidase domain-containing protein n=1 Tax=Neolewinella litorea TaxID=2562452 RepID=UPI003872F5F2